MNTKEIKRGCYTIYMKFSYVKKEKTNIIPKTAGVYVFLKGKEILYIGKAANLRDRVHSHFAQSSYRDNLFVSQVTRIGYCETQSEIDALLLESQLIKKHQPKYNVIWKDDKKYFFVAVTKETLPRVFLTHQPHPNIVTIGPFVEGKDIKQVLRLLRKAFPYYTRSTSSGQAAKKHPILLCPYCHIGLCPGPKPNAKEYKRNIKNLAAVLRGGRISVLKNLKKSMAQASKEQDFEKAAVLRDQVFALENITKHSLVNFNILEPISLPLPWQSYQDIQKVLQKLLHTKRNVARIEAYDISNIQGKQSTGSMVTFLTGRPAKEWYRKFKIHITGKPNDFAMMQELISRRLKHTEWPYPDLMLIDGGKGQLSSALKAILNLTPLSYPHLKEIKLQKIKVVALAKRNNELFSPRKADPVLLRNLPQEVSNLLLHVRDEAHRFAISYHRKLRRVDALKSS